ncbi:ARC6/PARC6 family protein [Okeania hirsuta]|uniref:ARC6/PARC6 family protein n=1 Tax=Okeania hirsuta TaxID=1458930 RepID=UPI0035C8C6DE
MLTSESAVKVVRDWLEIKGEVLGSPPNRQLLSEYTVGAYYDKTWGTIDWLIKNRAYYTYDKPSVELVGNFQLSGKLATIDVQVYEFTTLHYIAGGTYPEPSSGIYRFTLEFSNGKWKIAKTTRLD